MIQMMTLHVVWKGDTNSHYFITAVNTKILMNVCGKCYVQNNSHSRHQI